MEAIYLQSMTDFVLAQRMTTEKVNASSFYDIQTHINKYYDKVFNYANFLKQLLQLGFFVPCGIRYQNVLEEPNYSKFENSKDYDEYVKTYSEAKERVLFKGFTWDDKDECLIYKSPPDSGLWFFGLEDLENETIETFGGIEYKLELTDSAKKQIGL